MLSKVSEVGSICGLQCKLARAHEPARRCAGGKRVLADRAFSVCSARFAFCVGSSGLHAAYHSTWQLASIADMSRRLHRWFSIDVWWEQSEEVFDEQEDKGYCMSHHIQHSILLAGALAIVGGIALVIGSDAIVQPLLLSFFQRGSRRRDEEENAQAFRARRMVSMRNEGGQSRNLVVPSSGLNDAYLSLSRFSRSENRMSCLDWMVVLGRGPAHCREFGAILYDIHHDTFVPSGILRSRSYQQHLSRQGRPSGLSNLRRRGIVWYSKRRFAEYAAAGMALDLFIREDGFSVEHCTCFESNSCDDLFIDSLPKEATRRIQARRRIGTQLRLNQITMEAARVAISSIDNKDIVDFE